uniref:Uncharacterized protein n=1 Tax=uncultured organism TaxID=155900 RepID=A0A385FUY3_9ZZZZ|nr:hypothetical protein TRI12_00012 [uncultured organism]
MLTDQERLLASEVKQLERQLVALAKTMPRRTQTIALPLLADTGLILPGALLAVAWWCEGEGEGWPLARWHFIRPLLSQDPPLIYQPMKSRFNPLLNVFQTR